MKIVCECGAEHAIHCPPLFMEITRWTLEHGADTHRPNVIRAVCVCGEERLIGPGTLPELSTRSDLFAKGNADGDWFEKHAACGTN
jgi:hypothetical protein